MSVKDEEQACLLKLHAICTVVVHLGETAGHMDRPADPRLDRITAEMRDAMGGLSGRLSSLLEDFVGPVWGLLPDDITEACRKAGM